MRDRVGPAPIGPLFSAIFLLGLGLIVAYLGSFETSFTGADEVVGPVLFWAAATGLALRFPLRRFVGDWLSAMRTKLGAAVFWPYLALHLVIYGALLELLLGSVYGFSATLSPSLTFSTNAFGPPSLTAALADVTFSPTATFTIPPVFSGALSLYSICVAFLVDLLVVVNVVKTSELGRLRKAKDRAAAFFVLPAVGVVLGASCCLSVPALVSITAPAFASTTTFAWIYTASYFLFPAFALAVLFVNVRAVERIRDVLLPSPLPERNSVQ